MHDPLPHLRRRPFPALRRRTVETLQVNLGYYCNQSCTHCHVNAGPQRKEMMDSQTAEEVLSLIERFGLKTIDLTGGAPELNPHFRHLVRRARALGCEVIDRCNLTVLLLEGQEDLASFLAEERVQIYASLPCYMEENTDSQRGKGVFSDSISALRLLNRLGYGTNPALPLVLVHNPIGTALPAPQCELETSYRRQLRLLHNIEFTSLVTITNMPIARFGSMLISQGRLEGYLDSLQAAHRRDNEEAVMCRSLISVDWQGYVYDCDFNQMLGLDCQESGQRVHIRDLDLAQWKGRPIRVAGHCYGCTAGNGSSCTGSLNTSADAEEPEAARKLG